ncbi:MAG TPA: hypothetical protein VEA99_09310 [Gemmatimonadaceae bacterium]|nr:hypothetical protein [Gemmatimonadaceae bacterium]
MSVTALHPVAARPAYVRPETYELTAAEYIACILEGRSYPVPAVVPPTSAPRTVAEGIGRMLGQGARG